MDGGDTRMEQALLGGAGAEVPPEGRGEFPQNSLRIPSEFSPSLEMGRSGVATTLSEVLEDSAWDGRVGR